MTPEEAYRQFDKGMTSPPETLAYGWFLRGWNAALAEARDVLENLDPVSATVDRSNLDLALVRLER